jgi:hypothetical protein
LSEEIIALKIRSYDASGSAPSPPYLSLEYDEKVSSTRSASLPICVSEIVARFARLDSCEGSRHEKSSVYTILTCHDPGIQ